MQYRGKLEYSQARKMRERNTRLYRFAHWPIWIWVFFLAPGPLTFSLFAHGFGRGNSIWLGLVLLGTGVAALRGRLPGAEPAPYILRFDEDKPNPLYRRVCYTFAWNAVLSFALLNLAGLAIAAVTGTWYMKQIYLYAYAPLARRSCCWACGSVAAGAALHQRRRHGTALLLWLGVGGGDFETILLLIWKTLPATRTAAVIKLAVFVGALLLMAMAGARGALPRTRPIVAGESMVAD